MDIMPENLNQKKKRKHTNKERCESKDVLSRNIVKSNNLPIVEICEIPSGCAAEPCDNKKKKKHKVIKSNPELMVETCKIESSKKIQDVLGQSITKNNEQLVDDTGELTLFHNAEQHHNKKKKRHKQIQNDDEIRDTCKIESRNATQHINKYKKTKHRNKDVGESIDKIIVQNNEQLVEAGELMSGSATEHRHKKRKRHKMIKNDAKLNSDKITSYVDVIEEQHAKKKKKHKLYIDEKSDQLDTEDVPKTCTKKSCGVYNPLDMSKSDLDIKTVTSDEGVLSSDYTSDSNNNKERQLSPKKSSTSISGERSTELSDSEIMNDDDYILHVPDEDALPDYTVLDEKSRIKWPLEGVGPPHFRYFLAEKENDIVHPPEQLYQQNVLDEKRLKSLGWKYRSDRWTYKEDDRLRYNWNKYLKDYPKLDPLMVLSSGRRHRFEGVNFTAFSKFLKGTKFYLRLAHGLNRTLYTCYTRSRLVFHPRGKTGKFSAEEIAQLTRLQAQHGNKWHKIATLMDRHGVSVGMAGRRYVTDTRRYDHGFWLQEEFDRLKNAVHELSPGVEPTAIKNIKWMAISEKVKTRSPQECGAKWHRSWFSKDHETMIIPKRWSVKDRATLIKRLSIMDVYDEIEIDWKEFANSFPNKPPAAYLRLQYYSMKVAIPHYHIMSFNERRDYMFDNFMPVNPDVSDDDDMDGAFGADNGPDQADKETKNQQTLDNQDINDVKDDERKQDDETHVISDDDDDDDDDILTVSSSSDDCSSSSDGEVS